MKKKNVDSGKCLIFMRNISIIMWYCMALHLPTSLIYNLIIIMQFCYEEH